MKLLLLGPSESGKTTMLKQAKIIHLDGYYTVELQSFRSLAYQNVLQSMVQLLTGVRQLRLALPREYEDMAKAVRDEAKMHVCDHLSANLCVYLKILWRSDVIQEAYERRSAFQLMDCGNTIVDVRGQTSERRKWITVFDNVNAVIFFAAISEYDQLMAEDGQTNWLRDALRLFNEVGGNRLFDRANVILFLNKKELFEENIKRVPLNKNNYENATKYIIRKFEKHHREKKKTIYSHLTCAKDTDQMQLLTKSLADMVIANMIKQSGISR